MKKTYIMSIAVCLFISIPFVSDIYGANKYFTETTDNLWSNPLNWDLYELPLETDTAWILGEDAVLADFTDVVTNTYIDNYGKVTVSGTDTSLENSSHCIVGYNNDGRLDILNGAHVINTNTILGFNSGSSGSMSLQGVGTTLTSSLSLGNWGDSTLSVRDGAAVSSEHGSIASYNGVSGLATIDGSNSSWTVNSVLTVGSGGDGMLNIMNGADVSSTKASVGKGSGSVGITTINGTGSTFTLNDLSYVGYSGTGEVNIINGGNFINSSEIRFGYNSGSNGRLNVSNNGSFASKYVTFGWDENSNGTGTIDGAGSTCNIEWGLTVGQSGTGVFNITNGGSVTSYSGTIAKGPAGVGQVNINGINSVWNTKHLTTGYRGQGNLTIKNGGEVISEDSTSLGYEAGSNGTLTVDGLGSRLTNNTNISIGVSGAGTLNVSGGGQVLVNDTDNNTYSYIGQREGSSGTVTVNGTQSTLTFNNRLYVGYSGSGSMTVSNGGSVICEENSYARSNSTVRINGPGSCWNIGGVLGVTGDNSLLEVSDEGLVDINGRFTLSGSLILDGGYIQCGSLFSYGNVQFIGDDGFSTIEVAGDSTLQYSSLDVQLIENYHLEANQLFTIIDIGETATGQFSNLAENSLVGTYGGVDLFITYQAGDGNDVALYTTIPEPATFILLGLGTIMLRKRRK